jgi:6-phosphogluconolactonase
MAPSQREVVVATDADALARMAAERLLARAQQANGRAAICLTGGSSPQRLYRNLADEPYRSALPWDRIHWFIGDERFVPPDDARSNMGVARRMFLDDLAPAATIHPVGTDAGDPDTAARRYEAELKAFYGAARLDPSRPLFDLVLMGLGEDGHTASLFPGASALQEHTRWAVGVAEAKLEPFVPRITLTFPTLAASREMLFLVPDAKKRDVLARVLRGENLPAAHARSDGDLVWLVAHAALPNSGDAT